MQIAEHHSVGTIHVHRNFVLASLAVRMKSVGYVADGSSLGCRRGFAMESWVYTSLHTDVNGNGPAIGVHQGGNIGLHAWMTRQLSVHFGFLRLYAGER